MMLIQIIGFTVASLVSYRFLALRQKVDFVSLSSTVVGLCGGLLAVLLVAGMTGANLAIILKASYRVPVGMMDEVISWSFSSVAVFALACVGIALFYVIRKLALKALNKKANTGKFLLITAIFGCLLGLFAGNFTVEAPAILYDMAENRNLTDKDLDLATLMGAVNSIAPVSLDTEGQIRHIAHGFWFSFFGTISGFVYGYRKVRRNSNPDTKPL